MEAWVPVHLVGRVGMLAMRGIGVLSLGMEGLGLSLQLPAVQQRQAPAAGVASPFDIKSVFGFRENDRQLMLFSFSPQHGCVQRQYL